MPDAPPTAPKPEAPPAAVPPPNAPSPPPPPATPPPAATPPPPPAPPVTPPANDKVLANIYKTFGMAVDDEFRIAPIPEAERLKDTDRAPTPPAAPTTPAPPPTTPPAAPITAGQPPTTPPPTPSTPPPAAPTLEVRKPATAEILELQKKVQADLAKFEKRIDELPKPPTPPATPPPPANPDAAFEATLPEENRETIEILRWAEANKQAEFKDAAGNYVAYLKRLDEFMRANPDEDAVVDFQKQNKPTISEATVRKLSREKFKAEAKAEARREAREELSPELNELRREQYELKMKPVLADASREFKLRFGDEAAKLPDGVERIDPAAAKEVLAGGEEAAKKHKIIAPILRFHTALADEYMDLSLGMKPYDPGNQMHRFLDQFIFHQEQVLLKAPPEKQIRNGKQFLPTVKYREAEAKDAAGTEAKFWMFSHDDVRRMIEINAHRQAADRRKEIAEAAKSMGFAEPTAAPAPNSPPTPPPARPAQPPEPPSPRSPGGRMPGAATNPGQPTQLQQAAGTVYPKELLESVK